MSVCCAGGSRFQSQGPRYSLHFAYLAWLRLCLPHSPYRLQPRLEWSWNLQPAGSACVTSIDTQALSADCSQTDHSRHRWNPVPCFSCASSPWKTRKVTIFGGRVQRTMQHNSMLDWRVLNTTLHWRQLHRAVTRNLLSLQIDDGYVPIGTRVPWYVPWYTGYGTCTCNGLEYHLVHFTP